MSLKKGAKVRLVQPVIEGEVVGGAFVEDEVQYLVAYTDEHGEPHQRYFPVEKLEEVQPQTES